MSRENDIVTIRIPLELRKQLAKAAARESRSVPGMAVHFLAEGVSHLEWERGHGRPACDLQQEKPPHPPVLSPAKDADSTHVSTSHPPDETLSPNVFHSPIGVLHPTFK